MEQDAMGEAWRGRVEFKDDLFLGWGGVIKERWL